MYIFNISLILFHDGAILSDPIVVWIIFLLFVKIFSISATLLLLCSPQWAPNEGQNSEDDFKVKVRNVGNFLNMGLKF